MLYLVDGYTEKALVEALKRVGRIIPGKVNIVNFCQVNSDLLRRKIDILVQRKEKNITIITDTDTLSNPSERSRFISNIVMLRNHRFINNINLIVQYNLEYELQKSLSITQKQLLIIFNAEGISELKSIICSESPKNLYSKIPTICETEFWSCKFHNIDNEHFLANISIYFSKILTE